MIITRTPFRVSFLGGGTDYPAWYLNNPDGGAVLSTTINKYCYIGCGYRPPFFGFKHRVEWSHIESVSTIDEILHPAVREGLHYMGFDDSRGIYLWHRGDLPARTGMGSSSSFAVGMLHALATLQGKEPSKPELVKQAIKLERDILQENVGSQDQTAVAYGGLNVIRFRSDGEIVVQVLECPQWAELQKRLLLFYTGTTRFASKLAGALLREIPNKQHVLRRMHAAVDVGKALLNDGAFDDFGKLMHENWQWKRQLSSQTSTLAIDHIYETARAYGALGGKLLGVGGAGFMLFYVPPKHQAMVTNVLAEYLRVPFQFEFEGSIVVYNNERSKR